MQLDCWNGCPATPCYVILPEVCAFRGTLRIWAHILKIDNHSPITLKLAVGVLEIATQLIDSLKSVERSLRSWHMGKRLIGRIDANPSRVNDKAIRELIRCL